ncbi:DNA mismatch repair protein MutS [Acetobacter fallax]|uniref:DNA mismatch repair protein MutS n=1 Tax=Acetobacter fallax TaxID=1737473 RepID=A0ABX0KAY5_9PROT|nr:DNA mismatch repair protein MutS [Acetobacter fallax]NHO31142.1 DNA mismatch repair protein MutS [Acetobacter fallax]NHO34699.1 DNA mismatch repair protein MutS [Acetobacter fallax]
MAQWFALKAENPEFLLFFRMGDFYELFFDDAIAAASALDIALTARGNHAGEPIAMCGVPVAAAPSYLSRLIRRGFRVAVAEQTATSPSKKTGKGRPGPAQKGPLPRAVVRLVTPGTLTEDELLEPGRSNLLVALAQEGNGRGSTDVRGAAWIDISTGQFETASCKTNDLGHLLARLDPAEILAPPDCNLGDYEARRHPGAIPPAAHTARTRLAEIFNVASLDAFGTFTDAEAAAGLMAVEYIRRSQAGTMPRLSHPRPQTEQDTLGLDPATRASLDLLRARDGGSQHTLFSAVNRTVTAAGARLLSSWIAAPLTSPERITARQACWDWLRHDSVSLDALRQVLRGAPDIDRALGRLSVGRGQPRDLATLRDSVSAAHSAVSVIEAVQHGKRPALLETALKALRGGSLLERELDRALADELPPRVEDGGFIASGYDGELDAQRALRDDSRRVIAALQNEYAQRFGVASLKIRHHAQLGYVMEVPSAVGARLRTRGDLSFRQGTASAARFSTEELVDLDSRIAEATERATIRERQIFTALIARALEEKELPLLARALALLDVVQSSASLATGGTWCRSKVDDSMAFDLSACRHPVVEAALGTGTRFTANSCSLEPDHRVMLLTGPNMAGKSTFLRQNALTVILAQAGLPVPAKTAHIGVVDRLFSRVGASDDLARGRSTFMVEMTETAGILNQASPRSLVVVDEIGRGTSTLDGLSIAWAVLETMHSTLRCRTIFATHFHELAQLSETLPRLSPHTMAVRDWKGQVVFLHEVVPGSARRSWGVHVARLAGVPHPVVERAARLLKELEQDHSAGQRTLPLFDGHQPAADIACEPDDPSKNVTRDIFEQVLGLDPDSLSPREALAALYQLKSVALEAAGHLTRP